ncbi:unnamed protein product, partial [Sphenostylis stenocarpa]
KGEIESIKGKIHGNVKPHARKECSSLRHYMACWIALELKALRGRLTAMSNMSLHSQEMILMMIQVNNIHTSSKSNMIPED